MQNVIDSLRECVTTLDQLLKQLAEAEATLLRISTAANDSTDIYGCHQPKHSCLFPKCGGRQQ